MNFYERWQENRMRFGPIIGQVNKGPEIPIVLDNRTKNPNRKAMHKTRVVAQEDGKKFHVSVDTHVGNSAWVTVFMEDTRNPKNNSLISSGLNAGQSWRLDQFKVTHKTS